MAIGSLSLLDMAELSRAKQKFLGLPTATSLTAAPASYPVLGAHLDWMLWSDQQWQQLTTEVALLDRIAHLPSLLPVIALHCNSLGLKNERL